MPPLMQIARILLMLVAIAETADCLRCLCQSSIDGVRVSPSAVECNGGTTCTIPESGSKGECYKEVSLHAESGAVIVTHSCVYMDRYDVAVTTACTNGSKQMACCSTADYCNAHLSLPNAPRGQSSLLEDPSTVDQGSDGQWLTWKLGAAIFSTFIAVVVIAGLAFFITALYVQCQGKHKYTSPTHV